MVDQIILAGLHILGGAKVDAILPANVLDLLVGTSQANNARVELLQVFTENLGGITGWITSDEHRKEDVLALGGLLDLFDNLGHLVQFIGADIRAMREAEVDLIFQKKAPSLVHK